MKGEKGGQQLNESNTIDEMSEDSFGTQTLGTTILSGDDQQNVIFTTATYPTQQVFKLNWFQDLFIHYFQKKKTIYI